MKKYTTNDIKSKRALSITEASDYACVSESVVRGWIASDLIPYETLPGGGKGLNKFRRIRVADLDIFLNRHYHTPQKALIRPQEGLFLLPKHIGHVKIDCCLAVN